MDFLAWSLRNFKRAYLKDSFKEHLMIANNSLEAYKKIKPELSGKRRAVYEMFCQHKEGATRQEISRWHNVAINSVCGRVNELMELGYLVEIGSKKDAISGCSTSILKPTERIA